MREVKFRGYAVEEMIGTQWIYGTGIHRTVFTDEFAKECGETGETFIWSDSGWVQVQDESVGQYTGLKDKKGVEIFEGDIVRRVCEEWDVDAVHKVIWGGIDYPAWDVKPRYEGESNFFSDYENADEWGTLEIIGNIYENPELLNEGGTN